MIETERLILRRHVPEDLAAYQEAIYGDPDVMKFLPGGVPRPLEKTAWLIDYFIQQWEQNPFGAWAIIHKADDKLIGHCGLGYLADGVTVEIFYAIAKPYWGQGLVTEAAQATLDYGFNQAGLERIVALAVPENTASRRIMEKLGMAYQGITNQFYNADLAYYVMTREEYEKKD